MTALAEVLDRAVAPGVHELDDVDEPFTIDARVTAHGWKTFFLDGNPIADKESFLRAVSDACGFPDWFGMNWDALADCLDDLSWQPATGYVLLYDHSAGFTSQPEWQIVVEILRGTAERWSARGTPFYVLLR